jgi:hypothetical protein
MKVEPPLRAAGGPAILQFEHAHGVRLHAQLGLVSAHTLTEALHALLTVKRPKGGIGMRCVAIIAAQAKILVLEQQRYGLFLDGFQPVRAAKI